MGKIFELQDQVHKCKLKLFKALLPGDEEGFYENLVIEKLNGFKYRKTEKRFVNYLGKEYPVEKNEGQLEKRRFAKFYATVPLHLIARTIFGLAGQWI